jgi:hypothetical protein
MKAFNLGMLDLLQSNLKSLLDLLLIVGSSLRKAVLQGCDIWWVKEDET